VGEILKLQVGKEVVAIMKGSEVMIGTE